MCYAEGTPGGGDTTSALRAGATASPSEPVSRRKLEAPRSESDAGARPLDKNAAAVPQSGSASRCTALFLCFMGVVLHTVTTGGVGYVRQYLAVRVEQRAGGASPTTGVDDLGLEAKGDPSAGEEKGGRRRGGLTKWKGLFKRPRRAERGEAGKGPSGGAAAGTEWQRGARGSGKDRLPHPDVQKAMLAELREAVDRHPRELRRRGRALKHDLDDEALIRFLVMAYWSMDVGGTTLADVIEQTLVWRETYKSTDIHPREVIEEASYGKIYVRGKDLEGRPIIYFRPGREKSFDIEKGLRLLIYTVERAIAMMPRGHGQFAVLVDCTGFHISQTPPVAYIKSVFRTLQQHYPMRLGYVRIVKAGAPMNVFWKLVSPVLHDRTKRKISFVPDKQLVQELAGAIHPSQLEVALGGTDPFVYSNEEYF